MSTEIARVGFDSEQVALIKRTICAGSTDDELTLFLAQCKRTGLDPFARQIHAVKRWDKKQGREVMSIQIGIDGFRLIGERTGKSDGQEGPFWCGEDGVWHDVWISAKRPHAAKVIVYRKGCTRGFVGIAHWNEYAQTYKDGNPMPMWAQMPANMLAKCAESLALRKAFPQELSGLYSPEEMSTSDDAIVTQATPVPEQPKPATTPPTERKAAPQLPATGAELEDRLRKYEGDLVSRGLCTSGALLTAVRLGGQHNGAPLAFSDWSVEKLALSPDLVKQFTEAAVALKAAYSQPSAQVSAVARVWQQLEPHLQTSLAPQREVLLSALKQTTPLKPEDARPAPARETEVLA